MRVRKLTSRHGSALVLSLFVAAIHCSPADEGGPASTGATSGNASTTGAGSGTGVTGSNATSATTASATTSSAGGAGSGTTIATTSSATGAGGTAQGAGVGAGGSGGASGNAVGAGGAMPGTDASADASGSGGSGPRDSGSSDVVVSSDGGLCGSAKFCDNFEGQVVGMAPTGNFRTNLAGGGTLAVDTTRAFSGTKSVLMKGPAGSFTSRLTFGQPYLPLASNDMHGRAMVYMTAVPGGGVHFDVAIGSGPLRDGSGNSSYILGGMFGNFMAVYHPGDCSVDSTTKFPAGRWACIQWEFKGATDGSHVLRMMMDGQLVNKGETTTMGPANCVGGGPASREWKAPVFNTLNFGWINYQATSIPVEMWVDDLAFGEEPIPCPPAP